jgi:2-succinyl-6-hydroxy-2,4-cyclohexadiene-1-carboxylate synthase
MDSAALSTHDPVILLHGFAQSPATWHETIVLLEAAGYRAYAPDILQVKNTEISACPRERYYSFPSLVATLVSWLDHEGFDRVNLVGYSMGGRIALHVAQAYSQRVSSLVLESCGLGPRDGAAQIANEEWDAALAARLRRNTIGDFVDYWENLPLFASQKELPPEVRERVRAERLAHDPELLARLVEGIGQHTMSDMRTLLREIKIPLLYMVGTYDEKYRMLADEIESSFGVMVRRFDTGHDIHLEDTVAFSTALCDFYAAQGL